MAWNQLATLADLSAIDDKLSARLSDGAGVVRAIRPPRPFGLDTAHSSAPSILRRRLTGELVMVYRQGTDHFVSRDGIFKMTKSSDNGRTWSAPVTVLTMQPTYDAQGQGITESADGLTLRLSYFKATAVLGAAGVFFKTSTDGGTTWSAETRIDSALPYAATTDVIVELPNGNLKMAYYGRSGAETWDSVWIATSTNGGTSWTSSRLANGQTAAMHIDEPVIAMNGATALMTFRQGANIGSMLSTNTLSTWSAATVRFDGTGKAHSFWVNDTTIACIYRQTTLGHAVMRYTRDNGVSWSPPRLVDPTMWVSGWMLYSAGTHFAPGVELVAFAQERGDAGASPGTSRIYLTYVGEAGAVTPMGPVPGNGDRVEDLLFSTTFEQIDGAPEAPWASVVNNGAGITMDVTDGELHPSAANQFSLARVYTKGYADVDIEADILTATGSGSGAGIMFRMVNSGTFLAFVAENAVVRLYSYASGTPTLLASSAAMTHQFDEWNVYRLVARGANLFGFYNGWPMVTHTLSAGNITTYGAAAFHGVKLLTTSSPVTNHRCRRFEIRS